jgi:hypothetical protein
VLLVIMLLADSITLGRALRTIPPVTLVTPTASTAATLESPPLLLFLMLVLDDS